MSKPTVLNNVDHKNLKIDIRPDANVKVNRSLAYATEINELHKEFPLVFYKNSEGKTQLHVILGLDKDENLYVDEKGWSTRFVPALLARGPFSLGYNKTKKENNEPQDPVICVDLEDPRVNTEQGEDVFLQFGGEAPYLNYYTVNQEKLAKLSGEDLVKLSQHGVLSLLYFVISSLGNFQTLMELKNAKSAMY